MRSGQVRSLGQKIRQKRFHGFADNGRIERRRSRRRRIVWGFVAGFLLIATVAGALVVLIPVRLFGISRAPLEYSMEAHTTGTSGGVDCRMTHRRGVWQCEAFDGQQSTYAYYEVHVSKDGCWAARSEGNATHGCLGFKDYLRIMDR